MITYALYCVPRGFDKITLFDSQAGTNVGVVSGNFSLELNEAGSLEFTVLPFNTEVDGITYSNENITPYETTIALNMKYVDSSGSVKDEWWPFVGRPISVERDMYGNTTVQCEGALSWLNDCYMSYWEDRYKTIREFINVGIADYNRQKQMYKMDDGNWREIQYIARTDDNEAFTFTKEYNAENRNVQFFKVYDGITEHVLDAYGGILHFVYAPSGSNKFTVKCAYYNNPSNGFDYNSDTTSIPDEISILSIDQYGTIYPSFGLNDNITNITEQYVKTDIWNGIMPIGEDGITKMGEDRRTVTLDDIMDINEILNGAFIGYADPVIKAIEFSEVKKGEDSGKNLVKKGTEYIKRFATRDYTKIRNYTINAIEPCEVFEATDKLVKPGYPVVVQRPWDGNLDVVLCLSLKHDFFNAQNSEYTAGPFIPQNIINEDISTWK